MSARVALGARIGAVLLALAVLAVPAIGSPATEANTSPSATPTPTFECGVLPGAEGDRAG